MPAVSRLFPQCLMHRKRASSANRWFLAMAAVVDRQAKGKYRWFLTMAAVVDRQAKGKF